jgi:hypothetical protein
LERFIGIYTNVKMPFLRPVNLPVPLVIQSATSVALGLYLTIFRRSPLVTSSYSMLAPAQPSARTADTVTLLGICITALEGAYFVTSYMPFKENQFIASSIPIRLYISAVLGSFCLLRRKELSSSGFWEFFGLAVMDGIAATCLGLIYGRFDGMVTNAERLYRL